jgi:hypothetical protein
MRTLELGMHRRARVWIGDLPDAMCPPVGTLTHTIAAGRETQNGLRLAAIEVLVPLGPRSMYGLLGGRFEPDATGQLVIGFNVTAATERLFAESLAANGDQVRVGLPAEYAHSVLAGVSAAKGEMNSLASGKLSFDCAAHRDIGSCEAVYRHLAAALVKLFNEACLNLSDDELVRLFTPTFT